MAINEGLKIGDWVGQPVADKLGRYEVLSILGRGGMGEVCLALDHHMKRKVAIKVIHFGELVDPAARKAYVDRFRREAHVTAGLSCSYVVSVYEYEVLEDRGLAYLTMQPLKGQDFEDYLSRLTQRTVGPEGHQEFFGYCSEVAFALSVAHKDGVVHRDMKPSNIFLEKQPNGRNCVKVLDFGIARVTMDATQSPDHKGLTAANVFIGTVEYMSPEQISPPAGVQVGPPTDVFSLGCLIFQALTGRSPFNPIVADGVTSQEPLAPIAEMFARHKAIMETFSKEAGRLPRSVPTECRKFIMSMLHKDPSKRPTAIQVSHFMSKMAGTVPFNDPAAPVAPVSVMLTAGGDEPRTEDDPEGVHGRATPLTPRQPAQPVVEPSGRPPTLAAITKDSREIRLPVSRPTRTHMMVAALLLAPMIGVIAALLIGPAHPRRTATRPAMALTVVADASPLTAPDASEPGIPNVEPEVEVASDAGTATSEAPPRRHGRHAPTNDNRVLRRARRALELQCCEHQPVAEALGISTCEFADNSALSRRLRCGHH